MNNESMNRQNSSIHQRGGFTLVETMIVLVIIGLLSYLILPNILSYKSNGELQEMKAKASQLNAAMAGYLAEGSVRAQVTAWAALGGDDARYAAIKPYMQYPPSTLAKFLVEGYTITFPSDPRNGVTLKDPDDTIVEYQ